VSTKDDTTIIEGHGTQDAIQGRIGQIKVQIEETTSDALSGSRQGMRVGRTAAGRGHVASW
jgi:hypothetical protein